MDTTPFDPTRYLTKVNGQAYLPVRFRMLWYRLANPDGVIETELLRVDDETCIARAIIRSGNGGLATGHKCVTRSEHEDYIERAETGAIGRALAALGYGTQFCPEFSEGRVVDSPVAVGAAAALVGASTGNGHGQATTDFGTLPGWPVRRPRPNPHGPKIADGQFAYLHGLGREHNLTHDDLKAQAWTLYGRRSTKHLSKAEADDLQDRIKVGDLVDAEMPPDEAAEGEDA